MGAGGWRTAGIVVADSPASQVTDLGSKPRLATSWWYDQTQVTQPWRASVSSSVAVRIMVWTSQGTGMISGIAYAKYIDKA